MYRLAILLTAILSGTTPIQAAEKDTSVNPWELSGYATLGYSYWGDEATGFKRDISQLGRDETSGSFAPDSRAALQLTRRFGPSAEAVVQGVTSFREDGYAAFEIEWAFLAVRPVPELTLRFGRLGVDAFLLSDSRSVGYAQLSIRPNHGFYGPLPIHSLDGIDVTYWTQLGNAAWKLKSQIGQTSNHVPVSGFPVYTLESNHFVDFTLSREVGSWLLKLGVAQVDIATNPPVKPLVAALIDIEQLEVPGVSEDASTLRKSMQYEGTRVLYSSIGTKFENADWILQSELALIRANRPNPFESNIWYGSIGRKLGNFTPYVSYSLNSPRNQAVRATSDWDAVPGGEELKQQAETASNLSRINQRMMTMGLRWDLRPDLAIKIQVDEVWLGPDGYGLWDLDWKTDFGTGTSNVRVISVGIDGVF